METFSALLAFCAGNSPVISPHKGQWRGAFMFPVICAWTNSWANKGVAGDLRRHRANYDGIVMLSQKYAFICTYRYDSTVFTEIARTPDHNLLPKITSVQWEFRKSTGWVSNCKQSWKWPYPIWGIPSILLMTMIGNTKFVPFRWVKLRQKFENQQSVTQIQPALYVTRMHHRTYIGTIDSFHRCERP